MIKKDIQWYLENSEKNLDGCMLFPKNSGRSIKINGKLVSVSKLIYEKYVTKIPLFPHSPIKRICKNGNCINPNHMLPSGGANRFFEKVNFENENGCWEWIGAKDGGGYGMGVTDGKKYKAHRYSWEYYYGEIPNGMWVLHKCDNPSCVRPSHLFLGTNQDNMNDKTKKERQSRLFGDRNGRSIMTKEKVIEMRTMYSSGKYSYRKLSTIFGISMTQTGRILKRESWSWV